MVVVGRDDIYILSSGSVYNKKHTLSHQNWKLILQQISIYYLLEIRTVLNGGNTQTNKNIYYSLQTARSLIIWMCGCVHIYRCIYIYIWERERGGERGLYGMMGICKTLLPGLQKRLKRMGDTLKLILKDRSLWCRQGYVGQRPECAKAWWHKIAWNAWRITSKAQVVMYGGSMVECVCVCVCVCVCCVM